MRHPPRPDFYCTCPASSRESRITGRKRTLIRARAIPVRLACVRRSSRIRYRPSDANYAALCATRTHEPDQRIRDAMVPDLCPRPLVAPIRRPFGIRATGCRTLVRCRCSCLSLSRIVCGRGDAASRKWETGVCVSFPAKPGSGRGCCALQGLPDGAGCGRHSDVRHAVIRQCVHNGIHHGRGGADSA